ncbi:hypothetical protein WMY93_007394 [Mugilogobius chulae]|uniref:ribonuclease H n=1 Tax=Mugilogobius chulae TaxID=88201 RepID=A0AAW0PCU6_9GOBI
MSTNQIRKLKENLEAEKLRMENAWYVNAKSLRMMRKHEKWFKVWESEAESRERKKMCKMMPENVVESSGMNGGESPPSYTHTQNTHTLLNTNTHTHKSGTNTTQTNENRSMLKEQVTASAPSLLHTERSAVSAVRLDLDLDSCPAYSLRTDAATASPHPTASPQPTPAAGSLPALSVPMGDGEQGAAMGPKKAGPTTTPPEPRRCSYAANKSLPPPDSRAAKVDYDENLEYINAISKLTTSIEEAFPPKIDMTLINRCRQKQDESPDDFVQRLTDIFDANSGLKAENPAYETHLCNAIVRGLRPDIFAGVRQTYVGLLDSPKLIELCMHARHAYHVITLAQRNNETRKGSGLQDTPPCTSLTLYTGQQQQDERHRSNQRRGRPQQRRGGRDNRCFLSQAEADNIPELQDVPAELWAKGPTDVGLIKSCQPVVITPKSDARPCRRQYPLRPEAVAGITPVFEALQEAGVIVQCENKGVCSPIFPVKKHTDPGEPEKWRFTNDLKAVNEAVAPLAAVVPNPYTILSQVPTDAKFFSVVDLANAFFSIPVHKDSQFWFTFEFKGRLFSFSRVCQGYIHAPALFNAALRDSLAPLELSPGSCILQYVDDLLLCAPTAEQCRRDTVTLLKHLHSDGHKASLSKLQFAKEEVIFLGHVINANGKSISSKRIAAIQNLPKPKTKKQLMSFLGICSYCRQFIANYSVLEAPLSELIHGKGLKTSDTVTWTEKAEKSFCELKQALQIPPTLGLPDNSRPFTQTVDERNGCMVSVLLQSHGGSLRPVAYFSAKLDPVAAGMPRCLRAVAAAEKAVVASRDFVGYADLTLLVPHAVSVILLEQKTSHMSSARWLKYNAVLLELPNVTVKRCTQLNPATLLPTPDEGEPHSCIAAIQQVCSPRPDLQEEPLTNPDLILYVDGSASRDPNGGKNRVGFSVCTDNGVVASGRLPPHFSAQTAELVALTEACKFASGKSVTIYTDSRYAFGVCHDWAGLWRHRNFLKSDGKPILNSTQVAALLDAILLPSMLAICKCQAHTNSSDPVSRGNSRADAAAKSASCYPLQEPSDCMMSQDSSHSLSSSLAAMQTFATPEETTLWSKSGATKRDGVWLGPDTKPCLPKHFFRQMAIISHGRDHVSKGGMLNAITQGWFTKGFTAYAQKFCQTCAICLAFNPGKTKTIQQAAHPPPDRPFAHVQMDFIELTPCEGKKYCLVLVDIWSRHVEAFPCKHASSNAVVKALITEVVPRWGIPEKISSDNGSHFVNKAVEEVGRFLGINLRRHCSYHPQSCGATERANGTLKAKLIKICEETGLTWVKALPLALMYTRMRVRSRCNMSPFEILFARPPNIGMGPPPRDLPDTTLCDDNMLSYCKELNALLSSVSLQVKAALPKAAEAVLHDFKPGDWVLVKETRRKHWRSKRWLGPFQVLLITDTAVKFAERSTWTHASHCRRIVTLPEDLPPASDSTPETSQPSSRTHPDPDPTVPSTSGLTPTTSQLPPGTDTLTDPTTSQLPPRADTPSAPRHTPIDAQKGRLAPAPTDRVLRPRVNRK